MVNELQYRAAGNELWWDFRLSKPGDKTATYTDYDGSLINIPANDQQGFYDFEGKIRAALGGNRGSKSQTGVKLVVDLALGKHPTLSKRFPVPNKGYIIAPKWEDNIQTVILEKLKAFIPRCYLKGGSWDRAWSEGHRRLSYANGSFQRFFTYTQDRDVLGGVDLDYVWMDEHGPYSHYLELRARLADRDGIMILTYTPEEGLTWEMEEVIEAAQSSDDVKIWYFPIFGNPFLNPKGVQEFADSIKDKNMRDVKLWGRPVLLTGAVIPMFDAEKSVIPDFEIPPEWPRTFVLDAHDKTPHAMLWMAFDEHDNCYWYRTIKRKGSAKEIANCFRVNSAGERIDLLVGDEANDGDGRDNRGNLSFHEDLRREGIRLEPTGQKTEAAFKGGIHKLRDGFSCDSVTGKPKIFIFKSCDYGSGEWIDGKPQGSVVWELGRYRYKKEQKSDEETLREQIANINDHFITCGRYGYYIGPMGRRSVGDGKPIIMRGSRRV
jgi:phage terminase large subunit-like protein